MRTCIRYDNPGQDARQCLKVTFAYSDYNSQFSTSPGVATNSQLAPVTLASASHPASSMGTASPSQDQEDSEEEIAVVKRLPAVTLQVWESLLKPRGYEISSGKLIRSPSKSQGSQRPPSPLPAAPVAGKSVISTFRRANSFAPQQIEASGSRQPFRRTSTLLGLPPTSTPAGLANPNAVASCSTAGVSCCPSLFTGLTFRTIGEAKCVNVHTALQGSGGRLASENTIDDVDYVVVRLVR